MHKIVWILILCSIGANLFSQSIDFEIPSQACLSEMIPVTNNSSDLQDFIWDFCQDGLKNPESTAETVSSLPTNIPVGMKVIFDQGNWYGFVCSREGSTNKIVRLLFGTNLETVPTILPDFAPTINGVLNGPSEIEFIKIAGTWFGFVINYYSNKITRLNFGASLSNSNPAFIDLAIPPGQWSEPYGIDVFEHNGNHILAITGNSSNSVSFVDYSNTLADAVPAISSFVSIADPLISSPVKVGVQKSGVDWFALVSTLGGRIILVDLGSEPVDGIWTINEVAAINSASALQFEQDGGDFFGFIQNTSGNMYRLDFGSSIHFSPTVIHLGNFGGVGNVYGLSLVKEVPEWKAFFIGVISNTVHRLKFNDQCMEDASLLSTTQNPPVDLLFRQSGTKVIELTAKDGGGNRFYLAKNLDVQNLPSPQLSFSLVGSCISSPIEFNGSESTGQGLTSMVWDFGDGNVDNSNSLTVVHQYSTTGLRNITLSVVGSNSCTAEVSNSFEFFDSPQANFDLPVGSTCTNSVLTFPNTSVFAVGASPSWSWSVNGQEVSNDFQLSRVFSNQQTYVIKLVSSIDGCQSEITKDLTTLSVGPTVDFSYTNNCFGEAIIFSNGMAGVGITSHKWIFGDGAEDPVTVNPTHQYTSAGTYTVELEVSNDQGCSTTKQVDIVVSDGPLAGANYTPAVENVSFTLNGEDLTGADDAVNSWQWDFGGGDVRGGNPVTKVYDSPGTRQVNVEIITTQGCTYSFIKDIVVSASQEATLLVSYPINACINERIDFKNTSVNASGYQWDFCFEDLPAITGVEEFITIPEASVPEGIHTVYEEGFWYSFLTSRDNNKLFKIKSSDNLTANRQTNEVVVSGLSAPMDIRLVKLEGVWYGFIINSGTGTLSRLRFGDGLESDPDEVVNLGDLGVLKQGIRGFDLVNDADNWYASFVNFDNHELMYLTFGSGTSLTGAAVTPITSLVFTSPSVVRPIGTALIKDNLSWHGLITSFGTNSVVHINLGVDLQTVPASSQLSAVYTLLSPFDLSIKKEGSSYKGYVLTSSGALHYLDFGPQITADLVATEDKTNFGGVLRAGSALELVRTSPTWKILVVNYEDKRISLLYCNAPCSVPSMGSSIESEPAGLYFGASGSYTVEVTAFHRDGDPKTITGSITVNNKSSPPMTVIISDERCLGIANQLEATPGFTSYNWDFGDGTILDGGQIQNHTFNRTGNIAVRVRGIADNGCSSFSSKEIMVSNIPVAKFDLPVLNNSPICTNQQYVFENTSQFDSNSQPSWNWFVNGNLVSNERDLAYAYTNTEVQSISLTASLPGCSSEASREITDIKSGPYVDFVVDGICIGSPSVFVNNSQGDIIDFNWELGDGTNQQSVQFSYQYATTGSYLVKLTANSLNGCNTRIQKNITIYSNPQPNFSIDLPPFSCAGTPTQFHDLTPPPNDSNIQSWSWSFGDGNTGDGKNPTHTFSEAGTYNVELVATTDQGCNARFVKEVEIAPSPTAEFSFDRACVNQSAKFVSVDNPDVIARQWKIDNVNYSNSSPNHVFLESGLYNAQLTVTATNACTHTVSKTIKVNAVPTLNFALDVVCEDQPAQLVNSSSSEEDPIQTTTWLFDEVVKQGMSIQHTFTSPGTYPVQMKVVNLSGCEYELVKNITIYSPPTASFTQSEEIGAAPLAVTFSNTSIGASSYQWLMNGSLVSSSKDVNLLFEEADEQFVIDLIASNDKGCESQATGKVEVIIPRTELALEQFNLVEDATSGTVLNQLVVRNNGNFTIREITAVVDLGNGTSIKEKIGVEIPSQTSAIVVLNNSIVGVSSGFICIELENSKDEITANNRLCNSLTESPIIFTPSPNPVTDYIRIDLIAPGEGVATLEIVNSLGIKVSSLDVELKKGLNNFQLDVSNLQPGMYMISMESGSQKTIYRLVIQ